MSPFPSTSRFDNIGLLDALGEEEAPVRPRRGTGVARPPFVGRDAELRVLEDALADVARGRLAVVDIQGPSGIGKRVERFIDQVRRQPGAVVFRGRCHPQESVSYNGFDGIIDDLSEWLCHLPDSALADVLPSDLGALRALFPVLDRIPAVARK